MAELKKSLGFTSLIALGVAGAAVYGRWEASGVRVVPQTVTVRNLPPAFAGTGWGERWPSSCGTP